MQETMTIKEVEEVIKMKLFTFIADYKGGTYISQYVAKTLEEALNLWINNVDFFTDKQLKSFKKNIKYGDIDPPTKLNGLSNSYIRVDSSLRNNHEINEIMKTFTFLVNANDKHCFVHQYQSEMPTNDLFRELVHDTSHISSKMKSLLIRESLECYHDNGPVKLDCVKNVWRDFFLIDDLISLYNANIAKKYHEGCGDRKYYKLMYLYDVNMIETDMSDTVFPLSEKATFTFITYIRNYNASYQFEVTTLEEGLMLWATNIDILNRQQRKVLLKYIQKSKNNPIAVEGVKNVWSTSYRIFRPLLTLHIVKTVS